MKKLIPILSAAALSITAMGAAMAPATAAPYQQNQMQRHDQHQTYQKKPQPKFERHGSYAYYNGKKGYKAKHSGYRYYNGYWFPPAAFVAGGLIFGAIVNGIVQSQR